MKLRAKLSLIIGALVLAAISVVGGITATQCYSMGVEDAQSKMETSATLVSAQIAGRVEDFMITTGVTGHDAIITSKYPTEVKLAYLEKLAETYKFTSANLLDENGISYIDGTDYSDRQYVKDALAGKVNISEITLSKLTNKYGFSLASPVVDQEGNVLGVIYYRIDVDFVENILTQVSISDNSITYLVDGEGNIIVHPDENVIGNVNILEENDGFAEAGKHIVENQSGSEEYKLNDDTYLCGYSKIPGDKGWTVVVAAPKTDFIDPIQESMMGLIGVDVVALIIAIVISIFVANGVGGSMIKVSNALDKIAQGDLSSQIKKTKRKDEIGKLQNAAADLQLTFGGIISEANTILGSMANYNLTENDMNAYPGQYNQLSESINKIKVILNHLIREVQESASSVGVGSSQLADAADALSQGTVAQANSIDQVVTDVQDMADRINDNFASEEQVQGRLAELDHLINDGNDEMMELRSVVKEVEEMSSDIQKIVGAIDSIAFQTNILALNASVEAARAGENGKGFAVVADEVGALAAKTSEASKTTADLIGKCLEQIENAMRCADTTFNCLHDIVEQSSAISEEFNKIANDTKEQAEKSSNIKSEITNISDVVQTNTATAEETAAATSELSQQAKALSALIQKFQV